MENCIRFVIILSLLLVGVQSTKADLYNGSLSYPTGITAPSDGNINAWASTSTSITWVVTQNANKTWHYSYTFTVPEKDISHFILEVSDNFTSDDFLGFSNPLLLASVKTDGSWIAYDPAVYNSSSNGNSNPGMPGDIYGIKFELKDIDSTVWHFEFDSTKQPMWGDFYAVDGKKPADPTFCDCEPSIIPYAYNMGFGNNLQISEGHIAVPDTVVPLPGAILLGTLGILVSGIKLRKFA
ncbi:MAG: hypothetical protein JXA96_06200 [Sedimentisphaerales bacterium]|nr:hypothetical protein [Sedimentisphaerales bacterium]